jgi:hypothetical protein
LYIYLLTIVTNKQLLTYLVSKMKPPTPLTDEFFDSYEIQMLPIDMPKYGVPSVCVHGANFELDHLWTSNVPPALMSEALCLAHFYTPQGIIDHTYEPYLNELEIAWETLDLNYDPVKLYDSLFLDYTVIHPKTTYYIDHLEIYAAILGPNNPYTIRQFIWAFTDLAYKENYDVAPMLLVACCTLLSEFFYTPDLDATESPQSKSEFFFQCLKVIAKILEETFVKNRILQQQLCRYLIQFISSHIPRMQYATPLVYVGLTLASIHITASKHQYTEELARVLRDPDTGILYQKTTYPLPEMSEELRQLLPGDEKTISALSLLVHFHRNYFVTHGLSVDISALLQTLVGFQMNLLHPFDKFQSQIIKNIINDHAPPIIRDLVQP